MYFSRITLNQGASQVPDFWRLYRDPYSLHQAIWKLFADHADRRRDFLYRLDEDAKGLRVYTVSARPPNTSSDLWAVESKPYEPNIRSGMRLAFALRANPACKKDGKRHDVVMESKQRLRATGSVRPEWPLQAELVQREGEQWLESRSENNGFHSESVRVDGYRQFRYRKGGSWVGFSTMDFSGILTLTDTDRFLGALRSGIGPAKAFGCGMLMVRRV